MVYAIWGTLGVIIVTGISMAGLPLHAVEHHKSPAQAIVASQLDARQEKDDGDSDEKESPLKDVHETAADLLYVLIFLHLAGVVFETRRSGREIVLAMIPGRR
jgi:cytochrome b